MQNIFRRLLLPSAVIVLIFIGTCLLTPNDIPKLQGDIPWDKIVHFGMFFVLSAAALYNYYRLHEGQPSRVRWIFWGFLLPVCYGGLIEILQAKYFYRSAEWGDFVADTLGTVTALLIALFLSKKSKPFLPKKRKKTYLCKTN